MLITKSQLDTIIKNAPPDVDPELLQEMYIKNGYEIEGVDTAQAKQYIQQKESGFTAPITETQEPEKQDGLVKTIAKDAVSTLVAKPAIRATEAATRVFAPNSMAAEGFGIMADRGETQTASIPLIGDIEVGQAKEFGEGGGRELASDALKVGSFLFPYGKVAQGVGGAIVGGSKLTPAVLARGKIGGQIASGVAGGYMADVGYNLADENKTLGESFIPGLGTALGAAIPLAGPAFRGVKAATKSSKTAEGVTKRVIQGQTKDIPLAQQAFSNIDLGGIKTRGELSQRLQDAMEKQMSVVDNELAKDPRALSLDNYAIRQTNNAGQEVKTDVISNALAHLEDFFIKAGDNVSASNIGLIRNKAVSEGLTHQEVNNIARMYAEEFGSKAFNKLGDPLTSVSAQMFENVRNGLKQAARGGLGFGEEAKVADRLYSAMNNTKRLIDKGVEGVNKLDGRLKQRNILQKLSNTAVKAMNSLTGGALKAGVEALGVSNVGNKIDNWIDLERSLQRDLEFIQKANTVKSENALIKLIEDYAKRLKFPGDKLLDDAQSRLTATNRIASNTKNITPSVSISKTIPQTSKKVKGEIPSKLRKNSQAGFIATGYKGESDLTTKILKDLEGKTTVSKQYILDATNRGELKQVERDLIRDIVSKEGDTINVADFAKKVKAELLPLKREPLSNKSPYGDKYQLPKTKYENIALPDELRGNVKNYEEQIYSSPIKTSAGSTHFGENTPNYFGHTRIEDMADNKTRRVIEVQSDLYQKGNLERELKEPIDPISNAKKFGFDVKNLDENQKNMVKEYQKEMEVFKLRQQEVAKLQQYNDPTAHFRMVREEIKKAAQDGKTKLQFPTGETAMKIEGLGEQNLGWNLFNRKRSTITKLEPSNLEVGSEIQQNADSSQWIITDVLGDGKFKAVPKDRLETIIEDAGIASDSIDVNDWVSYAENHRNIDLSLSTEQFDISGKVDTNNPIYKFYEKEVQKYLNKFGGKRVVDDKGVSWVEVPIKKEYGKAPVEAFGKSTPNVLLWGAGIGLAGAVGAGKIKKRKK